MKKYSLEIAAILAIALIVTAAILGVRSRDRYVQDCLDRGRVLLETMRGDVICVDVDKTL